MHVSALKTALKTLLNANASQLVTGLTGQGQARTIGHITTSVLTPAKTYYFVAVHVEEASEFSARAAKTVSKPPRGALYNCMVHVEDYAIPTTGEDELFEIYHGNFELFTDRIADLVEQQAWIGTAPKTKLVRSDDSRGDRSIVKSNSLQAWFDDAENGFAQLTTQIRFQLIDECVSNLELYT